MIAQILNAFVYTCLSMNTAAFAGELSDEVEATQRANAAAANEQYRLQHISEHIDMLQRHCRKTVGSKYGSDLGLDIDRSNCMMFQPGFCFRNSYYARFTDGTVGEVGWDSVIGEKPFAIRCNVIQ